MGTVTAAGCHEACGNVVGRQYGSALGGHVLGRSDFRRKGKYPARRRGGALGENR